ncbi:hypothetical protein BKE38_11500 [Pseudoroseomonas deserti]|uniref:DUF3102 domain-containing protein n=1 Tax=Teichococcus deserti TaxID=1817963 RepID=A0A1V2H3A3_9PROT|nr:hypothetical protein [Pseudoroseomonas deserti]ONG53783.1 hypothetical protein BKE38_11500 [Pseudoroseomonas deserti]
MAIDAKEKWGARKAAPKRASILTIAHEDVATPRSEIFALASEDDVVQEIGKLWDTAQRTFLSIGRLLSHAERQFRGSFERDIVAKLPFNRSVAHMLRTVAEKVDQGYVPEAELPRSYAAAFRLVTLEPDALEQARQRGLVAPGTPRSAIERFRQELRTQRLAAHGEDALLAAKREELQGKIERARKEMERWSAELAGLERQIIDAKAEEA